MSSIFHVLQVIYMLRNPKDQIVSFYNFARKILSKEVDNPMKKLVEGGWDTFFKHALDGKLPVVVCYLTSF